MLREHLDADEIFPTGKSVLIISVKVYPASRRTITSKPCFTRFMNCKLIHLLTMRINKRDAAMVVIAKCLILNYPNRNRNEIIVSLIINAVVGLIKPLSTPQLQEQCIA